MRKSRRHAIDAGLRGPAAAAACAALVWAAAWLAPGAGGGVVPAAAVHGTSELTLHGPRFAPPAAPEKIAAPVAAEEIARLAARPPLYREPILARYMQADDFYRLMQELLRDAESGERISQFYLYLTLARCQTYLRLDADEARELNERMRLVLDDRPTAERVQWEDEYRRCRGFAGGDLGPLKSAMGDELPGAESEYASIWFQRAATAGYPPALAEGALRINTLSLAERIAMLEEAVASDDAEVYWMLFHHSPVDERGAPSPAGAAWLLQACRAGYDCTRGAEWFRGAACLQDNEACTPDESALEHFWYRLPAHQREDAWRLAGRIARDRVAGRFVDMPWPELGRRNIVDPN